MDFKRIVVAVDYSVASLQALETAFSLNFHNDAVLYLVHVTELGVASEPAIGMVAPPPEILRRQHIRRLGALIPEHVKRQVTVKRIVQTGPPAKAIADFARAKKADLIVAGTHGRRGLSRMLLGSTAESLLRYAPCQVLVVKQKVKAKGIRAKHTKESAARQVEVPDLQC